MAVTFLEPGGDATFDTGLWSSVNTLPAVATDFVHGSHLKSIKYRPNTNDAVVLTTGIQDLGTRYSLWLYIVTLPSATSSIVNIWQVDMATVVARIRLTSAGVLQLWDNLVQQGADGSTLSTGVWYRVSFAMVVSSTTVNDVKVFLNGTQDISIHNATLSNTASASFGVGNNSSNLNLDFRSSDHYFDNSSALTDPGNIWVTAKRPNANGTTNNFTTQIGTGGSGQGTGHARQVNEQPRSNANGWSVAAVGATTEEYNIEGINGSNLLLNEDGFNLLQEDGSKFLLDTSSTNFDISTATIVDYMGWVDTKALVSETGQIIVNNVASNIAITTVETVFTQAAGSTSYPAGTGTDIGIVTSATATTVSLYECGIVFAYTPAVVVAATSRQDQLMLLGVS